MAPFLRGPLGLALLALVLPAQAQTAPPPDAELAGLALADAAPTETAPTRRTWQASLEPALRQVRLRGETGPWRSAQGLGLDLALDLPLGGEGPTAWRLLAADRLDLTGPERLPGERRAVNTLKELYATQRPSAEWVLDLGRINNRLGVASGYNPTDYFKRQALRNTTAIDPASLRENRLGVAMARVQKVWDGGSLTGVFAPKLADAPSSGAWSPDWGASNGRPRWLLAWTQAWAEDLAPQWLLHGDGQPGHSPQLGLNLTRLLNQACVAHLELSTGRSRTLLAQALGDLQAPVAQHTQLATGLSCTTSRKLTLTAEWQHNGLAPGRADWSALQTGDPLRYGAYRQAAQAQQEPATRDSLFLMLRWQDALAPKLDLNAFARISQVDHSRLLWLEARYHQDSTDWAAQWQQHRGQGLSEFGALPQARVIRLLVRHYF